MGQAGLDLDLPPQGAGRRFRTGRPSLGDSLEGVVVARGIAAPAAPSRDPLPRQGDGAVASPSQLPDRDEVRVPPQAEVAGGEGGGGVGTARVGAVAEASVVGPRIRPLPHRVRPEPHVAGAVQLLRGEPLAGEGLPLLSLFLLLLAEEVRVKGRERERGNRLRGGGRLGGGEGPLSCWQRDRDRNRNRNGNREGEGYGQ